MGSPQFFISQMSPRDPHVQDKTFTNNEVPLQELHDLFIKHKLYAEALSPVTVKSYKQTFNLLLQFKSDICIEDLTEETLVNFIEFLNTRPRKVGNEFIIRPFRNSSLASVRGKLNSFFKWLIERHYLTVNPFSKIKYPLVSYTDKRAFTLREFERISFAINTKIKWQSLLIKKRNAAILMFLIYTGVRKEELLGLKLFDIDLDEKVVSIRAETSKSKRGRIIPLNRELIPYLEDYLYFRINYNTTYLWVSGYKDREFSEHGLKHFIKLLTKVTNINCHIHRARHTFAANYYKLTNDILGLKKLMGHTSLKMTMTYLRSLPAEHTVEQINKVTMENFF